MTKLHITYFIISIFLSLLFISCGEEKETEEIIRPVRYQEVIIGGSGRLRVFSGTAKAGTESRLSFKVSGTVKDINVKVGDVVKRGQLMALIDATDYSIKVKEAEAGLKESESQEINAKNNYDRAKSLYETNSIAKSELDAARAQFESTRANVDRMRSTLQLAKLQLSYTRLLAPFDGMIANVPAEENENVNAGNTIVTISSEGDTKVEISVPGMIISQIKEGTKVEVSFSSIRGELFKGLVSEVGVSTGGFSTTYPVTVNLVTQDDRVRPGMAAEVQFNFNVDESVNKILVPAHVVGEDAEGNYVFTLLPDSGDIAHTHKQRVIVGNLTGTGLEIQSGLVDGDLIVTAGISRIQDGQKVKLLGN